MNCIKSLLTALVLIFVFQASAQRLTRFSHDPEPFLKELSEFMNASKKKIGKDLIEKEFGPLFISRIYTPSMKDKIYNTCDLLLEKKFKAFPDFENYVLAVMAFPTTGKSQEFFEEWHSVLFQFAENKKLKKFFPEFLYSSMGLFSEGWFYNTKSVTWFSSSKDFQFVFDSVPKIVFPELNLIGKAKGDSTVIYNTKGVYFPSRAHWYGENGLVNWSRADLDPTKTYCEFEDYELRIKGGSYIIDSVKFYTELFDQPLIGQLQEKVLADKTGDKASYPRFESYNKRLQIKNVFENVDYDGGFTMAGNKLAGTGTIEEPALIVIHRENKPFMTAKSLEFAIRPDRISSGHVEVLLRLDNDSIVHPDVNLKFDGITRKVILLRTEDAQSRSPYFNSYHNIDMYFEALYWNIDDPLIELGALKGSTQRYAAFESKDYYKKSRYNALTGMGETNPLVEIKDFVKATGMEAFYVEELAKFLRMGVRSIHPRLIDLSNKGFVDYDINTEFCRVNQKLFDTLARNAGGKDYDVLQLSSEVGAGNNAQLNLLNYNLLLKGVKKIHLSDSQEVAIYPSEEQVVMKKNRDFRFGGRIWAGNFEMVGKQFFFDYDKFQIELEQVDSCRIYVEDDEAAPDRYGNRPKKRVKNVLEGLAGTLKIDAPTNKGGVLSEDYPQYPILNCTKESYVYYDSQFIQGGVYDRDKFYYQVEPFVIDSLDNFTKSDMKLNGTLVSAGIFPDINEPLVLMEDLSLGFDKATSSGGLPAYGGAGNFTDEITLDYDGLHGKGELEYLTTSAFSDYFTFFPDSTKGRTTKYENREQPGTIELPKAIASVIDIAYFPTQNLLTAETVDEPITFFNDEATLKGKSYLRGNGMTANGTMKFSGAELDSDNFNYTRRKILADSANFRLNQEGAANLAFRTDNINSEIDFDKRMGQFKSNGGETKIEFPVNDYICFMDEFKWFMDNSEMELSSNRKASDDFVIDTNEDQATSNFFSVSEFQDSLNFLAPKAIYDIENNLIECNKIRYIAVADSKIIPDSGKVVIEKRANMRKLSNATVISNYVTQFHRIYNSDIDIRGRLYYEGEGDYTYTDENEKEQIIHINDLKVDTTQQTIGNGLIPEDSEFFLSPHFGFWGGFELYANSPFLTFDGGANILHTCENIERNWMKFKAEIDPKDIFIPVDTNLRDMRASKLGVGVMVADDEPIDLYSTFLSAKKDRKDEGLIEALGYLYFDKNSEEYKVGSKEKIRQPALPGNLVTLDTKNCEIRGDGTVDFKADFGLVKFGTIGKVKNDGLKGTTNIEGTARIDFLFDEGAIKHITDKVLEWPTLNPVEVSKTQYEKSIREIMGLEASDKVISELNISGQFKRLPKEMQSTLFFADVKWDWNEFDEAYQSVGALAIATIDKKQVFRYVKGKIEVERRASGDALRIYLELDPANWYFFEYKRGIMNVSSTDKELIGILAEVKDDKKKIKENKEQFTYQIVASKGARNKFVDRFSEFD